MNASKWLMFWSMLTITMIFIYIWHQNAVIQQHYQRQYLERNLLKIKKEIEKIKENIAESTTPDKILPKAAAIGLQKTSPKQIHTISSLTKEDTPTS